MLDFPIVLLCIPNILFLNINMQLLPLQNMTKACRPSSSAMLYGLEYQGHLLTCSVLDGELNARNPLPPPLHGNNMHSCDSDR